MNECTCVSFSVVFYFLNSVFFFYLAFAWGDTLQRWHEQPLQWSVGGLVIAAPPCPAVKERGAGDTADAGIYGGGVKKDNAGVHGRDREERRKRYLDGFSFFLLIFTMHVRPFATLNVFL